MNSCNGGKPLADAPRDYAYSSCPGHARKSQRVDWIGYDDHHRYWRGLNGGKDPAAAYRKFVNEGLNHPADPKIDRLKDWVYGEKNSSTGRLYWPPVKKQAKDHRRLQRSRVTKVDQVIAATAQEYGVTPEQYCGFRSSGGGRDVAAYLCRRYTAATLAQLSEQFGLGHPDSSSDLVKRAKHAAMSNPAIQRRIKRIEKRLDLKPESRV